MKTLKYFALLCFLVCFTACSSDDDSGSSTQNYFTYQGKIYELKAGLIEKDGTEWSDDGSMEYYITLVTSTINIDANNDISPTENIFSVIDFNLYSKNNNQPKTGSYTFNEEYNIDYTFDEADVVLDVNWEEENEDNDGNGTYLFITSGDVELHKTGSSYKMDFEFTTHTNEIIKGQYEGNLIVYEYEDEYPRPEARTLSQKQIK